jgi:hypothetical protein
MRPIGVICNRARRLLIAIVVLVQAAAAAAQPAAPQPDPGSDLNVFYGETPPGGDAAPAIVFVHGLRGHASDWWIDNPMYELAHGAGYRTAFININADLTRNDAGIAQNAAVLTQLLPRIAQRFLVSQLYIVTHSKGGVDVQAALLDPVVSLLARAVFQIAPPNHGSELADWAFGPGQAIAGPLGLLTPGVSDLKVASMAQFRAQADPVASAAGTPYFTMPGNTFLGNPLTSITGAILSDLTGGAINDGLVPINRTRLPAAYATDLGIVPANHFGAHDGSLTFPRIQAEIERIEGIATFERVSTGGFGDRHNSFAWSMGWFKGHLYVGTGRAFLCTTAATADRQTGSHLFRSAAPDLECAATVEDLPLSAEIWRYSPTTRVWQRVFKSPEDVPVAWDAGGQPIKFTARDMAFRDMAVFTEADRTKALYVAGVSASAMFDRNGPYAVTAGSYPPPRILRTTDGFTWEALPQTPGTFLGDIAQQRPGAIQARGFRSMHVHAGKLWVSASDFRGVGFVIASSNPSAGDDAWAQASPPADELPIWTLATFKGWLYATTGDRTNPAGYGVWKTRGEGQGPHVWQPVVTQGGFQVPEYRSPDALSLAVFKGNLYVGTDRPTELIRIHPDDTWDLVVGGPRVTPDGDIKRPLSGLLTGFGNLLNGHFWRMTTHDDSLFLGTWDWSIGIRAVPFIESLARHEFGADFYNTSDGIYWNVISKTGFGDPFNYGVRTVVSTPAGLFVGTANPFYGAQVWRASSVSPENPDPGGPLPGGLASPAYLEAASVVVAGGTPMLTWQPVTAPPPDEDDDDDRANRGRSQRRFSAVRWLKHKRPPVQVQYEVYRSTPVPVLDVLPADFRIQIPGTGASFTIAQIRGGALDSLCVAAETVIDCEMVRAIKENAGIRGRYVLQSTTTETSFIDHDAPADVQTLYYVRAVDSEGRVSLPSNIAGGPSLAEAVLFSTLQQEFESLVQPGIRKAHIRARLLDLLHRARRDFERGRYDASTAWIDKMSKAIDQQRSHKEKERKTHDDRKGKGRPQHPPEGIDPDVANELILRAQSLARNIRLVSIAALQADLLLQ